MSIDIDKLAAEIDQAEIERLVERALAAEAREQALAAEAGRARGEGCICQGCGTRYHDDLIVPDEVWESIKPAGKAEGAGLLCPTCIYQRATEPMATQVGRLEGKVVTLREQADALHRIGSALDVDPGADLTREAPARVEALSQQLSKAERLAEYESQSFRTLCFAIQRMEEIVGIDSGGYNGPGPALDAIERVVVERDALAAHVERFGAGVNQLLRASCEDEADEALAEINDARAACSTASLARLKAEWQAEALESLVDHLHEWLAPPREVIESASYEARKLRRQAEPTP